MPPKGLPTLAILLTLTAAGCGGSGAAGTPTTAPSPTPAPAATTVPATTTSSTVPAPTTTTAPPLPPDPQSTPLAAASIFIDGWKAGDRARSATVAVPAAVTGIFAAAYAGQTVVSRGCTNQFLPRVCSYGPNGGGSGALYQMDLLPDGANWYVSAVHILG